MPHASVSMGIEPENFNGEHEQEYPISLRKSDPVNHLAETAMLGEILMENDFVQKCDEDIPILCPNILPLRIL